MHIDPTPPNLEQTEMKKFKRKRADTSRYAVNAAYRRQKLDRLHEIMVNSFKYEYKFENGALYVRSESGIEMSKLLYK